MYAIKYCLLNATRLWDVRGANKFFNPVILKASSLNTSSRTFTFMDSQTWSFELVRTSVFWFLEHRSWTVNHVSVPLSCGGWLYQNTHSSAYIIRASAPHLPFHTLQTCDHFTGGVTHGIDIQDNRCCNSTVRYIIDINDEDHKNKTFACTSICIVHAQVRRTISFLSM